MANIKGASARGRRSKAEVQEEFEKIKEENLQESLALNLKSEELAKIKESEVRQVVKEITVEGIVQGLANLGIEVSKALSALSSKLTEQTELLTSLREAVDLETKEMQRLHKIDITATSLDQLIEEYDLKKKDLEQEVETLRTQLEEEQRRREREQKEFEENIKKARSREKEEYEYQKLNERKIEEDQYSEAQRILDRKNKEKQEVLEKSWSLRESSLKEKEDEFLKLKTEVVQFPERLKNEIDKAAVETTKVLEIKHKQDLMITQKDGETEKRLAELKIKSLEDTTSRQFITIESLQQKLEEAKNQVQDIAVKAIEGASGSRALSHVNQIAMEQAKTRIPSA